MPTGLTQNLHVGLVVGLFICACNEATESSNPVYTFTLMLVTLQGLLYVLFGSYSLRKVCVVNCPGWALV